jgi:hypothetical protein
MHIKLLFKHSLVANAFISHFNTQTISQEYTNLKPWRDSNPGLLFLRRMRCPLRHAARAMHIKLLQQDCNV